MVDLSKIIHKITIVLQSLNLVVLIWFMFDVFWRHGLLSTEGEGLLAIASVFASFMALVLVVGLSLLLLSTYIKCLISIITWSKLKYRWQKSLSYLSLILWMILGLVLMYVFGKYYLFGITLALDLLVMMGIILLAVFDRNPSAMDKVN